MLTDTQITTARTGELERLAAQIAGELERRQREAAQLRSREREAVEVLESHDRPEGSYQWQMRRCGHPERCKKCQSGELHGPYLYCFTYRDGKRKSEYIRLSEARALGFERPLARAVR